MSCAFLIDIETFSGFAFHPVFSPRRNRSVKYFFWIFVRWQRLAPLFNVHPIGRGKTWSDGVLALKHTLSIFSVSIADPPLSRFSAYLIIALSSKDLRSRLYLCLPTLRWVWSKENLWKVFMHPSSKQVKRVSSLLHSSSGDLPNSFVGTVFLVTMCLGVMSQNERERAPSEVSLILLNVGINI